MIGKAKVKLFTLDRYEFSVGNVVITGLRRDIYRQAAQEHGLLVKFGVALDNWGHRLSGTDYEEMILSKRDNSLVGDLSAFWKTADRLAEEQDVELHPTISSTLTSPPGEET